MTGNWLPYPPPPTFPPPPPLACFDKMSLGSKVDEVMDSGTQAEVTIAPSAANDMVGAQAEMLGTRSVSGDSELKAQVVALGSAMCV